MINISMDSVMRLSLHEKFCWLAVRAVRAGCHSAALVAALRRPV